MKLEIHKQLEEKMNGTIDALKFEFGTIRAGRANAQMLDKIRVDYYGTPTPINQIGAISVPEPRILMISPWDKSAMHEIEKAIANSDLGLNPSNDGEVIRLSVPALTEERRKELAKKASKASEEFKVRIRNERRDANEKIKKMEKGGEITEDELKKAQDEVQKMTDKFIKEIDALLAKKEKDIMEV
ncbi:MULTISPECIES: ribosome recycling factor [unclassified Clostridioides]|uniref:ribosome recycling factor n=1 Tax=unclassified Clostridioides TaxID=2635829 RepID=UPI001D11712E|nr:ribosome recycling factor [Clostridioides sp. ZZV15-6388]MCC0643452.1 ribosome recycling factor [Clostridioides sp. ZZV14-6150]MCC0658720.1 ribosome recycling factor [Clostridioides sp. ZZV14-6154]MCC0665735.1 ribosome recycling factor [Clostridioides sp. ZZV15-6597]MCC0668818.1 ribosome recycling factor [Clostridioides sp. ZZV14-6153]MCC0720441.1 ribosome recycling factor [Clostridioides sp. ZZV14-6105]MCC0721715.1 ribosome recycling factor [Clostridioides sp. ZZV14-6104]MCC0725101.1 rib